MCVIATGLKKDFDVEWFKACCEHNPDGFFVSRVNRGQSIRTLSMESALEFFNASNPNDTIVLHARIKSVGPVNIDNVHGWQSQGVQFCHNGTLPIKARGTLTDSETFFRDIFLPLYRSANRKLTKPVIPAINALIGTSRFLIIRKKAVYRFGDFIKKNQCYFSNLFWDTPAYTKKFGYTSYSPYGSDYSPWWSGAYDYEDDYHTKPSNSKSKTHKSQLFVNLYPLSVTTKIYEVLKAVSRYVSSGDLPPVVQLAVGLDMTNSLDRITYNVNPIKLAAFPYRVYAYMLYFLEDWEGKEESIKALREKLKANPVLTGHTVYSFISSEAHRKLGATFRTATYSYLNDLVKKESEEIDKLSAASHDEATDMCTSWAKMSLRIFLMTLKHQLSYAGVSSVVRSVHELLDTSDFGCVLYVLYQTLREIGGYVREREMDSAGNLTSDVINGLYAGTYAPACTPQTTLIDFWGDLANEILNRTVPASLETDRHLLDARDRVLESFDLDVSTYQYTGPATYEAAMVYIKDKPGELK